MKRTISVLTSALRKKLFLIMIPMLIILSISGLETFGASSIRIGVLSPKFLAAGGGGFGGSGYGGMYDGAQMAASEINAAGGINVSGTMENIQLDLRDEGAYNPLLVPPTYDTTITTASMTAMLTGGDQFIVGGFRTETTTAALTTLQSWNTGGNTPVPFFICGAATGSLINNNETQNPGGQWVFRVTDVNETCLFHTLTDYVKQYLAPRLAAMYTNATYPPETPGQFRFAVIAEDLTWTQTMSYLLTAPAGYPSTPGYDYFLGPYVNTSGVQGTGGSPVIPGRNLVPAIGYDFTSLVSTLNAEHVHLIIDMFTMPEVNNLISAIKAANMPTMVVGIDVPGQQQSHWADTAGECEYECLLSWSGTATPIVPGVTDVFWRNFWIFSMSESGGTGFWPLYTAAGAYDAIYGIKEAIENAGTSDTNNPALLEAIKGTSRTSLRGHFQYDHNDVYCNSNGINWTKYDSNVYGYVREFVVQLVMNTTSGSQLNVVYPLYLTDGVPLPLPYGRRTMICPNTYPLAQVDINLDGKVSLQDLVRLALSYGSKAGDVKWDPDCDMNFDGKISLQDLVTLALSYGKSAPQWPLR